MATSYPNQASWVSTNILRRFSRGWLCVFLAVLSILLLHSISYRRQGVVIRPGLLKSTLRELRPQDDNSPFAHEPGGLGTLRDVRENNFYRGGTWTLATENGGALPGPMVFDPYPDYSGNEWHDQFIGTFHACEGPRGQILDRWNPEDVMTVYPGTAKNFPPSLIGSYSAIDIDSSICTNRYSRLTAYGYESNRSQSVDWNEVRWGSLQTRCFQRNVDRYSAAKSDIPALHLLPTRPVTSSSKISSDLPNSSSNGPKNKPRSAVILRAWHDMQWTDNLKQYIRSLVMELSLHSGGEYAVFILCHVRDNKISLDVEHADAIHNLKAQFVPIEFSDMTVLFNDQTLEGWYPRIEEHSTKYQYWQPVQILSQIVEGFDYYWQLEMDSRIIGHTYHFLEQAAKFAKAQPRKYLWERNSYFYIPGAHGSWAEFMHMVDNSMRGRQSIWGPMDVSALIPEDSPSKAETPMVPSGPKPPVASPHDDKFEWGVGEESDLITFLPTFDPVRTGWLFRDTIWGLLDDVPRQASPVAMARISNKLAQQMHEAQSKWGVALASEMTAPTLALWHGLKAVHVPQPIYVDGKWTPKELGRILNPGSPEKINGGEDSIWNWDHRWDHILYRLSYFFTAQTPEDLYRRWLGFKIDPHQYTDGSYHQDPQGRNWFDSGDLREDLYGPLCFPSMLLHPVKNTAEKKGSGMAVPV